MPYITQIDRAGFAADGCPLTAGELNYAITQIIKTYMGGRKGYSIFNDILGALEGAKLEFFRRVVVPYEEEAMKENGDVY